MERKSDESGSPRALKTENSVPNDVKPADLPQGQGQEVSSKPEVDKPPGATGGLQAKGGARPKVGGTKKRRSKAAKNSKAALDRPNRTEEQIREEVLGSLRSKGIVDELRQECVSAVNAMPLTMINSFVRHAASKNVGSTAGELAGNLLSQQKWNPSLNQRTTRAKLRNSMKSSNVKKGLSQLVDKAIDRRRPQIRKHVEEAYYSRLGLRVPGKSSEEDSSSSSSDDSEVDEELYQSWVAEYNEKYGRQNPSSGSSHQGVQNEQPNGPGYGQQIAYPAQSNYHGWYGMGPGMPAAYPPMTPRGTSPVASSASGASPYVSAQQSSPTYTYGAWPYPYSYQYPGASYGAEGGSPWQGMSPSYPYPQQYEPPHVYNQGKVVEPSSASVEQLSMELPYMLSLPPPPPPPLPQEAVAKPHGQVNQDLSKAGLIPSEILLLAETGCIELAVNSASSPSPPQQPPVVLHQTISNPPRSLEDAGKKSAIQELEISLGLAVPTPAGQTLVQVGSTHQLPLPGKSSPARKEDQGFIQAFEQWSISRASPQQPQVSAVLPTTGEPVGSSIPGPMVVKEPQKASVPEQPTNEPLLNGSKNPNFTGASKELARNTGPPPLSDGAVGLEPTTDQDLNLPSSVTTEFASILPSVSAGDNKESTPDSSPLPGKEQ